ncbi:Uncharacterised protein [Mycobacterium tuberculosis]|nr:Uncharacterised protein [Mycobacterium tuberculosis]COV51573.1 Uncharacterised protein [Mycobacterium tuberculosis]
MPLVLMMTVLTGRAWAASTNSRSCLWMVGSPPENITTSGSPSAATSVSSIRSHCAAVMA